MSRNLMRRNELEPYGNSNRLRDLLGFKQVYSMRDWMTSRLVEPYWTRYHDEWLKTDKDKAVATSNFVRNPEWRMAEMPNLSLVIHHIEASGRQRFVAESEAPPQKTDGWIGLDWQAWLLLKLVYVNSVDIRGLFFQKNVPVQDQRYRMWQVVLRRTFEFEHSMDTLVQTPGRRAKTPPSPDPSPPAHTQGLIRVWWHNQWEAVGQQGYRTITFVGNARGMTWEAFIAQIHQGFHLTACDKHIARLATPEVYQFADDAMEDHHTIQDVGQVNYMEILADAADQYPEPFHIWLYTADD